MSLKYDYIKLATMIKKIDNYDITNQIQNYFLTSVDDFCGIQFKSF